ncbi:hypothetical protein WH87_14685 [Devosia epidermidihirudinis]|uniref:Copper resistance protein CopC n=1 Tax=Devosia epidermidihirudinis TaxID=1293439 RepID=A0A0F5Q5A1_9HYPH|nr:copper resistance protein CopC [Devosia epidermidihirudinis]KKC35821.1 hypothetical protein WH87_14685 [Devosia epidermidihirudinis]
MYPLALLRLLLCTLLLACAPQQAWAHAQLFATSPVEGAVLDGAPNVVSLEFNEPVTPLAVKLIGADGTALDVLDQTSGGASVVVSLPETIGEGTQVLSWRVVSTDGHPIGGSLVFSIGHATGSADLIPASDPTVIWLLWASKALFFVALLVGVGGAVFRSIADVPRQARRVSVGLSIVGVLLVPATLGLQGLDALGLTLSSLFDSNVWRAGWSTSYGATAFVAGLAFAVSLPALLLRSGRNVSIVGLAAGALAALSLSLSGHASAAEPQWLTRPAVFLHITGILIWIGALLPLWILLREKSDISDRALASFSRVIPFAVAPLMLSGLVLAGIQMGAPGPQWLSPYGFILGAKLTLLIAPFALALANRLWLTRPALAGETRARLGLRRSIATEALIVLVILGLVAGWRFTPPPRALAEISEPVVTAEPIMTHLMDDTMMAMVTISPGSAGPVRLDITLTDFDGEEVAAQSMTVTLSAPDLGIEPFKREAVQTDDGWLIDAITIPLAGAWLIDMDVRVSRFLLKKLRGEELIP